MKMDQTSHFKECIAQHIVLNPRHIQMRDWGAVGPDYTNLETPAGWKRVPDDDSEHFERLITEDGLSYAFVSSATGMPPQQHRLDLLHLDRSAHWGTGGIR